MQYVNHANQNIVEYIGETVQSFIADDPSAEHVGMTNYLNGNAEVAFKYNGEWVTNNALGTIVIFKERNRHFFLPKARFEKDFKIHE